MQTEEFYSMVLHLENEMVFHGGLISTSNMSHEEFVILMDMVDSGLMTWQPLPERILTSEKNTRKVTRLIEFSDELWDIAHRLRKVKGKKLRARIKF
jgi:hypothetical protein